MDILEKIKSICKSHKNCNDCELIDHGKCMVMDIDPSEWDIEKFGEKLKVERKGE